MDKWMTIEEAEGYTMLGERTIREAVAAGSLQAGRAAPEGRLRFKKADLDVWLRLRGMPANAPECPRIDSDGELVK